MQIIVLGSGAAYPTVNRGASAYVVRAQDGLCWLFDCGEGTQTQLQRCGLAPGRIKKVFISHLHGDHVFGLPGLLCTRSMQNPSLDPTDSQIETHPLFMEIFGPRGLRRLLRTVLELSRSQLSFGFVVHELEPQVQQYTEAAWPDWQPSEEAQGLEHPQERPGRQVLPEADGTYILVRGGSLRVQAVSLRHRAPSFGFVLAEEERPGRLNSQKLQELGVLPGPLYGQIKAGQSITLPNGQLLEPRDVMGPPIPGCKLCIFGDCIGPLDSAAAHLCQDADLLVHEATLEDGLEAKAIANGHSTPRVAATFAVECHVRRLLLTHFSQRYKPLEPGEDGASEEAKDVMILKKQAEAVMGKGTVQLAQDLIVVEVPLRKTEDQHEGYLKRLWTDLAKT
uniref:zinc phosphodiesterase ELAC protein 1 isoform X2 n=1 Tax=Myxine glutinosa TaxID=7769 RepID=UPI00358FB73A